MMMFILDKLWEDGLHPSEHISIQTKEYRQAINRMSDLADSLTKEMTAYEKEIFEAFSLAKAEVENIEQQKCFIEAFRLGALLMLDILFQGRHHESES